MIQHLHYCLLGGEDWFITVPIFFQLFIVELCQKFVHVLASQKTHVQAVQQTSPINVELDREKTAFRIPNINENHHSVIIFQVSHAVISIVWGQTEPIINKSDFLGVQDDLSTTANEFPFIVREIGGDGEVVPLRIEVVSGHYFIYFAHERNEEVFRLKPCLFVLTKLDWKGKLVTQVVFGRRTL